MYLELAHGGHLGFYEGGLVYANPVTWLDRALAALVGGLLMAHHKCEPRAAHVQPEPEPDLPDLLPAATAATTAATTAAVYCDPLDKPKLNA